MLRLETESGWWLVTHPDHARLAGSFAEKWGNNRFRSPEPRENVLRGIKCHDDGWTMRDSAPQITSQGKPSAFSVELVGKYSAFEEIDLVDYLAVRNRAVRLIAEQDNYAALLISMHTYNLLTERADRTTIGPTRLPLLDQFLEQQKAFQQALRLQIIADSRFTPEQKTERMILEHFQLLQACDNLSLVACVNFQQPTNLLHRFLLQDGKHAEVQLRSVGARHFVLDPYPFDQPSLDFRFPARHIVGKLFASQEVFQDAFSAAPIEMLSVTLSQS